MPDAHSIPFRQASGNGHYESKQLPDDNADFLVVLGLPTSVGNVTSASPSSLDGQVATYWGTSGAVIKASTAIGVAILTDGVLGTKPNPAGDIVGTTAVQTLTNKTITGSTITGSTGISKADVGLANVDNTSDANKPVSGPQQTALNLKEDKANKGIANGYASLDATVKVPSSQLPAAVLGATAYQGTWNALSNTPVIPAASAANKGWYYVVSIAGSTMVDGVSEWAIRDWIVSNGNTWDKVDNTDAVTSVAGRMGAVVLAKADVGLDQVDNTSDATKNAATVTLTNKTINGNSNTLSVRLNADVVGNLPPGNLDGGAGASTASFWRGDGHWGTPAGGGDVASPGSSVDSEMALFNGVSGTILKRSFGTGVVSVLNGVFQTPVPVASLTPRLARNYLAGMLLANNAVDAVNDIDIAVGECRDDTNTVDIRLATAMTKQLDAAWVLGTSAGGRDTGAISDGWWHVYAIFNSTTSASDVVMTKTYGAPTMPSGFTYKRRIGSVKRATSIVPFRHRGDFVEWNPGLVDLGGAGWVNGQGATYAYSTPLGFSCLANLEVHASSSSGGGFINIRCPNNTVNSFILYAPGTSLWGAGQGNVWTDNLSQITVLVNGTSGTITVYITTNGYWDTRDKDR